MAGLQTVVLLLCIITESLSHPVACSSLRMKSLLSFVKYAGTHLFASVVFSSFSEKKAPDKIYKDPQQAHPKKGVYTGYIGIGKENGHYY